MALEKFQQWYDTRHDYQADWKDRTGGKVVGYFCTYAPEEIFYAFDILPVRILGSHDPQDLTDPHIFPMFCPACRDILAQGLSGRYDYLDGIFIGQSCLHLRQAYASWEIHRNPGWSHYLPMPNHVQSPRAVPFLRSEYGLLIQKLETLTGRTVTDRDLERGICLVNAVRRMLKRIYEYRKRPDPPITGAEALYLTCSAFFTHAEDWLAEAEPFLASLDRRQPFRETGTRLMLVGSENDDLAFVRMVEDLGRFGGPPATVVVEEHCASTRHFWQEIQENTGDPLKAVADRYCSRTPCPTKDWPERRRLKTVLEFARAYRCEGAILVQQKFCDPHQTDMPFVRQALETAGIPSLLFEFDVTTPVGAFSVRVSDFLLNLRKQEAC